MKLNILKMAILLQVAFAAVACQSSLATSAPPPFAEPTGETPLEPGQADQIWLPGEVRFNHLSLEEGLSQSTVTAILQDSQGFIWLGTQDGLNRFNGYEFTTFKHDPADPNSLSNNHVSTLFEDSFDQLWVGTEGGGLSRFNYIGEQFVNYRHDPKDQSTISSNFIHALHEDRQGDLWVGTNNGLNKFDRETGLFSLYPVKSASQGVNGSNSITAIHDGATGNLWLGTPAGLLSFNPDSETFLSQVLIPKLPLRTPGQQEPVEVLALFEDDAGVLWIGTRGEGLFSLNPESGKLVQYLHTRNDRFSLSDNVVSAISEDQAGFLWIGTRQGLDRFDQENQQFNHFPHNPNNEDSLSDSEVSSLFVDQAGILWVGTHIGGVNYYDPHKIKFQHITVSGEDTISLSHPQVWTFFEDKEKNLWVGTSAGLDKIQRESGLTTHYFPNPDDDSTISNAHVTKVIEDKSGDLWFATYGGLNRYVSEKDQFERYLPDADDPASLIALAINDIFEDSLGRLWLGTAGSGIDRLDLDSGQFSHFQYQDGDELSESTPTNSVLTFFEDSNQMLWIGTMGGLLKFDPESNSFSIFRHDPANPATLGSDIIHAIHQDQNGVLWLGTGNGLDRFDPERGSFSHYREDDGLPNNVVLGILEEATGDLWLSTNKGLAHFDPEQGTFRNYDTSDGLQSLEFNPGAVYQNDSGEMFFGGINGFNIFHPDDVRENPYSPPITLSDFRIQNEPVSFGPDSILTEPINYTEQIELSRADTVISFEMAALHYGTPDENQYAYLMEGFDRDWNFIGNRRNATYTNLPPGEYTFRAYGTNSDGVWGKEGIEVAVSVPYPFWQTWWFILLVAFLLAGVAYGGFRLRTRNTIARTRELEEQVVARTVEIERRRQIAEGLREIMVLINSNKSLGESLHYIVSQAAKLTDAEDAIIFRREEDSSMTIIATNPGGQIRYSPNAGLATITEKWAQAALLNKEPLIVPDLVVYWLANPDIRAGSFGSHRAMLGMPVVVEDEIYGGLIMLFDHERPFSDEDQELGATFADQATLAIANNLLRQQAEQIAVASERSRLARELHDAVTQTIFSASLIAETIPPIWEIDQDEGKELLSDLRQLTRGALAEMRTLLLELRPAALEEANLSDLLHQLAESVGGRTGIHVLTSADATIELPVNVKVALYRIAQESLNNVMKHARASQVELQLSDSAENKVLLVVQDDGRGFDPVTIPTDRLGLHSMRERAQAIGAILSIHSQLDQGTQIKVEWQPEDEANQQITSL